MNKDFKDIFKDLKEFKKLQKCGLGDLSFGEFQKEYDILHEIFTTELKPFIHRRMVEEMNFDEKGKYYLWISDYESEGRIFWDEVIINKYSHKFLNPLKYLMFKANWISEERAFNKSPFSRRSSRLVGAAIGAKMAEVVFKIMNEQNSSVYFQFKEDLENDYSFGVLLEELVRNHKLNDDLEVEEISSASTAPEVVASPVATSIEEVEEDSDEEVDNISEIPEQLENLMDKVEHSPSPDLTFKITGLNRVELENWVKILSENSFDGEIVDFGTGEFGIKITKPEAV